MLCSKCKLLVTLDILLLFCFVLCNCSHLMFERDSLQIFAIRFQPLINAMFSSVFVASWLFAIYLFRSLELATVYPSHFQLYIFFLFHTLVHTCNMTTIESKLEEKKTSQITQIAEYEYMHHTHTQQTKMNRLRECACV